MRILVLAISDTNSGNRQRPDYIAEVLKDLGHQIFKVHWRRWSDATPPAKGIEQPDLGIRLYPTLTRFHRTPHWNQVLVSSRLHKIVRKYAVDLVIWPNNWYLIGMPPVRFPVPLVIDYFDLLTEEFEKRYFSPNRVVLCASQEMTQRAHQWTTNALWVPTPIDADRFQEDRGAARALLGLSPGAKVISLIGLTAARSLYFMDAVDSLADDRVVCLLVGGGELLASAKQRVRTLSHPDRFVFTGAVSYDKISKYFAASDVGLYPGDDTDYFHSACPIKVLEYTAAGVPVVANDLRELRRWGFRNVTLAPASAEGFSTALTDVLRLVPAQNTSLSIKEELGPFLPESVGATLESALEVAGGVAVVGGALS